MISWFDNALFVNNTQTIQINTAFLITIFYTNKNGVSQTIVMPDIASISDGFTFYVGITAPIFGTLYFYPFRPNSGDEYYILNGSDMSIYTGTPITASNYKFVYYNSLPNFHTQGFVMYNLNSTMTYLPVNVNVFLFTGDYSINTTFNFGLSGPYLNGQRFKIVDKNGAFGHSKIQICKGNNNQVEYSPLLIYSTPWTCREFIYIGNDNTGLNGNFFCIGSSVAH